MSEIKVFYVGNDLEYWDGLKEGLNEYDQFNFVFNEMPASEKTFLAYDVFIKLYEADADIIYVDLSYLPERTLSLCKLLCRNNVTRLKSTVALHPQKSSYEDTLKTVLAGVRLNYRKGVDYEDVAFHPLSLLDAAIRPQHEYAAGANLRPFEFHQLLRVGYIADDHYRVETNSPLSPDEVIELEGHPLQDIMSGKRFFSQNYNDSDLYYNQRFSYNLKYTYVESPFFRASEDSWLSFKEERREGHGERERKAYIEADIERRRAELAPVKEKVRQWVADNESEHAPKRLKVLVIDETLEVFKKSKGNLDDFNYSINFQTHLTRDFYQLRRYRPHLIIFHYEEKGDNNMDALHRILGETKKLEGYEPYVLVFNCKGKSEALQKENIYEHLICYSSSIDIDIIQKMSNLLDERFHITEPEGKLFLKTNDPRSVAFVARTAKLLKFNESELYFESSYEIPMWTCFVMKGPFEGLITVLPMGNHSPSFSSSKNVYRALINGIGDEEKRVIRRLVNTSLEKTRSKS